MLNHIRSGTSTTKAFPMDKKCKMIFVLFLLLIPAVLMADDPFLKANSEELAEKLEEITSFSVNSMPLKEAINKLSRENRLRISTSQGVSNPVISVHVKDKSLREILREIKRVSGYEIMANYISVTLLDKEQVDIVKE